LALPPSLRKNQGLYVLDPKTTSFTYNLFVSH
jgi:hypothetical protein